MEKFTLEFTLSENNLSLSESLYKYLNQYCSAPEFTLEFKRRSHLFVPINKPRYLEKVGNREIAADGFIWDLEDSIPAEQKQAARDSIKLITPKPGNVEYNNITVNHIVPGPIDTTHGTSSDMLARAKRIANVPQQRLGIPEEIASMCVFLASDAARFITGQTLHINGGALRY